MTRAVELSRADAGAIYSYDPVREVFELAEAHGVDQAFRDGTHAIEIRRRLKRHGIVGAEARIN